MGFSGGSVVKNLPANAEDMGSILGQEDPTCCRATKPMATTTEPVVYSGKYRAHVPQLRKPLHPREHALQEEKPLDWEALTPHE